MSFCRSPRHGWGCSEQEGRVAASSTLVVMGGSRVNPAPQAGQPGLQPEQGELEWSSWFSAGEAGADLPHPSHEEQPDFGGAGLDEAEQVLSDRAYCRHRAMQSAATNGLTSAIPTAARLHRIAVGHFLILKYHTFDRE